MRKLCCYLSKRLTLQNNGDFITNSILLHRFNILATYDLIWQSDLFDHDIRKSKKLKHNLSHINFFVRAFEAISFE